MFLFYMTQPHGGDGAITRTHQASLRCSNVRVVLFNTVMNNRIPFQKHTENYYTHSTKSWILSHTNTIMK